MHKKRITNRRSREYYIIYSLFYIIFIYIITYIYIKKKKTVINGGEVEPSRCSGIAIFGSIVYGKSKYPSESRTFFPVSRNCRSGKWLQFLRCFAAAAQTIKRINMRALGGKKRARVWGNIFYLARACQMKKLFRRCRRSTDEKYA